MHSKHGEPLFINISVTDKKIPAKSAGILNISIFIQSFGFEPVWKRDIFFAIIIIVFTDILI